ncbi:MAG: branched-chain amino acid ABC transporter permease, partial [Betaproteobacteria bacterium]
IFGEFAKHWHLGLGLTIIASVALLPRGLVGVPGQLAARLRGAALGEPAHTSNAGGSHGGH